jgi:hypothetical protein
MSLDCIWVLPKDTKAPNSFKMLNIKRSFFYANEILAFKGSIYSEWLELNCGYTLYKELLSENEIKRINQSIKDYTKDKELKSFEGEKNVLSIKEIQDFIKMWNEMSILNAKLAGWW